MFGAETNRRPAGLMKAYQMVLKDIKQCGPSLLVGEYDAKHGNSSFMHGIETVMEFIAYNAGDDEFDNMFLQNMVDSKNKVRGK